MERSDDELVGQCRVGDAEAFGALVRRNMIGGEITEYTKLMGESRELAIDRMIEQARELGANAVICVRLSTSMLMGGAAETVAYGAAVVVD